MRGSSSNQAAELETSEIAGHKHARRSFVKQLTEDRTWLDFLAVEFEVALSEVPRRRQNCLLCSYHHYRGMNIFQCYGLNPKLATEDPPQPKTIATLNP